MLQYRLLKRSAASLGKFHKGPEYIKSKGPNEL
jgi:hypothetical protein